MPRLIKDAPEIRKQQPTAISAMKHVLHVCNNLKILASIFLSSVIAASLIFKVIEDRTIIDSFYWGVVTSTTTGFGDVTPKTNPGKILVMIMLYPWRVMDVLISAHLITRLVRATLKHVLTDNEQSYIMRGIRWCMLVLKAIAKKLEVGDLPPIPELEPEPDE